MAFSWNMWLQHFLKRTVGPLNLIFAEVIHFYDVFVYYAALFEFGSLLWKLDFHGYHGNRLFSVNFIL